MLWYAAAEPVEVLLVLMTLLTSVLAVIRYFTISVCGRSCRSQLDRST